MRQHQPIREHRPVARQVRLSMLSLGTSFKFMQVRVMPFSDISPLPLKMILGRRGTWQ